MTETLDTLHELIQERKDAHPDVSYVARMFKKGSSKIAQKTGEEAVETIVAYLSESREEVISESADLLFHLSVMWAEKGIHPKHVMAELERRMGTSGLDEKAARRATEREE